MKEHKQKTERYVEGRGGRKTAHARARIFQEKGGVTVNGRDVTAYFREPKDREKALAPFRVLEIGDMGASVQVNGGGIHAQSEAVRHAIATALVRLNAEFRKKLRRAGFLTRDARVVERKKYGLKKARRAPQWAKR